jgi:hypothetical protein
VNDDGSKSRLGVGDGIGNVGDINHLEALIGA